MCNYCICDEMDKCSIRGYLPTGYCCDKCKGLVGIVIEQCDKKVYETMDVIYEIPSKEIINQIFNKLEEKIKDDLDKFKEIIFDKTKKEMIIR
ncbi:MAG: hypothetical protein ACTSRP_04290 [Candidatus Helarchaeota archaeon]